MLAKSAWYTAQRLDISSWPTTKRFISVDLFLPLPAGELPQMTTPKVPSRPWLRRWWSSIEGMARPLTPDQIAEAHYCSLHLEFHSVWPTFWSRQHCYIADKWLGTTNSSSSTNDWVRQSVLDNHFENQLKELNSLILPLRDVSRYWIYLTNEMETFFNRDIPIVGIDEFITFSIQRSDMEYHCSRMVDGTLYGLPLSRDCDFQRNCSCWYYRLPAPRNTFTRASAVYHQDQEPCSTFWYGGPLFDSRQWCLPSCSLWIMHHNTQYHCCDHRIFGGQGKLIESKLI